MALLTSSELFRRDFILVGNMDDADGRFTTELGDSSRSCIDFTPFHFCKRTDDGKAYSGFDPGLQPLPEAGIRIEIDAQEKTEV